jgi:ribonuclease HII
MMIAGVDEVGRGPLAGPVVACAVILDDEHVFIEGLADSKKLSPKKREFLYDIIMHHAKAVSLGSASPEEIDEINILQASLLAMKRALEGLSIRPDKAMIDGTFCPKVDIPCEAIIKGDSKVRAISAASIVAKVTRDRLMVEYEKTYPGYGMGKSSGYPTQMHMDALMALGVTPIHRKTFGPVTRALGQA